MTANTTATLPTLTEAEKALTIVAVRKLALQFDTKLKYALEDEDEEQADLEKSSIKQALDLLKKLGDDKPVAFKTFKSRAKLAGTRVVVSKAKPATKRPYNRKK
jgi:hypothetical protein